jgi:hypothetical protein
VSSATDFLVASISQLGTVVKWLQHQLGSTYDHVQVLIDAREFCRFSVIGTYRLLLLKRTRGHPAAIELIASKFEVHGRTSHASG